MKKEEEKETHYQAYMLRLWRESADMPWRATLQDPHSQEKVGFASVEQLLAYIRTQTRERPSPPPSDRTD